MKAFLRIAALAVMVCGLFACGGEDKEAVPESAKTPAPLPGIPTLTIGHVGHDHQIALGLAAMEPEFMQETCGVHLKELKPENQC